MKQATKEKIARRIQAHEDKDKPTNCEPLKCRWFMRIFEARYMAKGELMDRWFMRCPSWKYPLICQSRRRKNTGRP